MKVMIGDGFDPTDGSESLWPDAGWDDEEEDEFFSEEEFDIDYDDDEF